ncbi:MAG TPA: methyltransferase domain-containing protein [Thermoplasmata archaeon]|jgi:2-polyprenyl-3-methyl-5-hydroxy-6-metoxy-1,4-benzoquinol methylase
MRSQPAPRDEVESLAGFLAAEGVGPGSRILDVPCGIGRRALGLAEAGFEVTAVDANETGMEVARARTPQSLSSRLRFLSSPAAAYPNLPRGETFDAILSLDHPVGRDGGEQDLVFLRRLQGHLAPQGVLVLGLFHRDFFAARSRPFAFHVLGIVEQHEFRSFDPLTGVLELTWKFYERKGEDLRHLTDASARLQLLTPHEARALLEAAGWRAEGLYGGWEREPPTADRRKLILVARVK